MTIAALVYMAWTTCVQTVHNPGVVQSTRTTHLQGVEGRALPVHAAPLVYAGARHLIHNPQHLLLLPTFIRPTVVSTPPSTQQGTSHEISC